MKMVKTNFHNSETSRPIPFTMFYFTNFQYHVTADDFEWIAFSELLVRRLGKTVDCSFLVNWIGTKETFEHMTDGNLNPMTPREV